MFGPSVNNGFRVPGKSTEAIRRHAMHVRSVFEIPVDAGFFPMGDFMEAWIDYGIIYDIAEPQGLPVGVEACCVPERGLILFSESTYQKACQDNPRARFTVVHELGHLALSHTRTFHREYSPGLEIRVFEDSEWQANQFSAEFLMPLEDILCKGLTTQEQIMMEYQVSATAATRRLHQIQKLQAKRGKGFQARQRSKP
ncbi:MAG: ImmA/IrrE family metallo-endopeptidase [Pigmentiphaga sp.]|nr:ImmA/IrrE family metallo-endopeptidase [Pigmentiphaga sp.]